MSFLSQSIFRAARVGLLVGVIIALLMTGAVLLASLGNWQPDDYLILVYALLYFGVGGAAVGGVSGLGLGVLLARMQAQSKLHDVLAWGGLALAGILILFCVFPVFVAVLDSCRSIPAGMVCNRP